MEALDLNYNPQGHSPQHPQRAFVRSRRNSLFGSCVVRLMTANPVRFLGGSTPALQKDARISTVHSLAAAEDYAQRARRPFEPIDYSVGRLPLASVFQRGNRGLG